MQRSAQRRGSRLRRHGITALAVASAVIGLASAVESARDLRRAFALRETTCAPSGNGFCDVLKQMLEHTELVNGFIQLAVAVACLGLASTVVILRQR